MMKRPIAHIVVVAALLVAGAVAAEAADVRILCANGMRDTVRALADQLEGAVGQRVLASFDEAGEIRKRLRDGEIADVIILPRTVMEQALADGKIAPGTTIDLAASVMGMGVRADAPKPDIGSPDALKRTLLAARSIVITDPDSGGVSGVHMASVFQRLGVAEELKPKLRLNRGGYNAEFVARGEADVAFQLANEVRAVPGIEFVPLPPEFQRTFVFSGALGAGVTDPRAAKTLQFLSGPAAATVIRAMRLDPVAASR
jgi:molybdate transport system substrate-binding protein